MAKKYIDADRLKAKLDEHYRKYQSKYMETRNPYTQGLVDALDLAEQVIDSLQQEQEKVNVEKVCGTCTYWQEGTLDRGQCQAGEPCKTHSAETCYMWERHEEIPIEKQPSEELRKEFYKWLRGVEKSYGGDLPHFGEYGLFCVARHFYELGKNSK